MPKKEAEDVVVKAGYFDDWKYKGFGIDLPVWFEPAYKKDVNGVKKNLPDFTDSDLIIGGTAINGDQADKLINSNKNLDGYDYWDSCWARVNSDYEVLENPYVYLLIFKKK